MPIKEGAHFAPKKSPSPPSSPPPPRCLMCLTKCLMCVSVDICVSFQKGQHHPANTQRLPQSRATSQTASASVDPSSATRKAGVAPFNPIGHRAGVFPSPAPPSVATCSPCHEAPHRGLRTICPCGPGPPRRPTRSSPALPAGLFGCFRFRLWARLAPP